MITRSAPCSILDWRYARATAAQWPEAVVTWGHDIVVLTIDAPTLHHADEACLAEEVIDVIGKSTRIHAVVRRES